MKVFKPIEKHETHYLIIVDSSTSMKKISKSTISGLNEQIETIKELSNEYQDQDFYLSIISFSNKVKPLFINKHISSVNEITENDYTCNGMTALYDAIGYSLNETSNYINNLKTNSIKTGMAIIITDGEENASSIYDNSKIKEMIKELEADNWTFTFVGANIDTYNTSMSLGMKSKNMMSFSSEANSNNRVYSTLSSSMKIRSEKIANYASMSVDFKDEKIKDDLSDFTGNIDLTK